MDILGSLKHKIIVSSQAMPDEPLYQEECMIAIMKSVVNGGAQGLRLAGARDVKNAKTLFNIPIIGLTKPDKLPSNWQEVVYITPGLEEVQELIEAGADIIAFDGTKRPHKNCELGDIINLIHNSNRIAMADISTLEEGISVSDMGADIISTTLSGYTKETNNVTDGPDFELLKNLVAQINKPIFLEGRVWEPKDVQKAFELGAHSVVIGSAITRPQLIVKRFIEGV